MAVHFVIFPKTGSTKMKLSRAPLAKNETQRSDLPPHVGPNDLVVLFDGVCKLCSAWARFLIRFDRQRKFKLASLQSAEGKAILAWHGMPTDTYEPMLLVEG